MVIPLTWKHVETQSDSDFVVGPDERLSWARTIGIGAQHVVAMFGATFLVPVLTGFPPATTLLFSGVGTVLFLLITGNRLPGYVLALILGEVDTSAIKAASWGGLPEFQTPTFTVAVMPMFLPAVIALVAENIGHVKSVGQMTATEVDPMIGRALAADGVATTLAGFGGGSATTTYAENIGVRAGGHGYLTAGYWVGAPLANSVSLFPKM